MLEHIALSLGGHILVFACEDNEDRKELRGMAYWSHGCSHNIDVLIWSREKRQY